MNRLIITLLIAIVGGFIHHSAMAQTMNNYTAYPPFINKTVPPAVMLMMTKDHRLFFKGYNDIVDLDNGKPGGDAAVDTTYKDNIDYVGYFDPKKCYDFGNGTRDLAAQDGSSPGRRDGRLRACMLRQLERQLHELGHDGPDRHHSQGALWREANRGQCRHLYVADEREQRGPQSWGAP